jgi:hypothetical protein
MKPKFTDTYKYPRGYVPSDSTDVARTWAAARLRLEQNKAPSGGNVQPLRRKPISASG